MELKSEKYDLLGLSFCLYPGSSIVNLQELIPLPIYTKKSFYFPSSHLSPTFNKLDSQSYCLGTVLMCSKLTKYGLGSISLPASLGQLFLEVMPESLNTNLESLVFDES